MKAITILQPWASLIVLGEKSYETRVWETKHTGPLLIHAGKKMHPAQQALLAQEPFKSALAKHGITDQRQLPLGKIIGTVHLEKCVPVEELSPPEGEPVISAQERAFGDYHPGRYAWLLTMPVLSLNPIDYKGKLGIFEVADSDLAPIAA